MFNNIVIKHNTLAHTGRDMPTYIPTNTHHTDQHMPTIPNNTQITKQHNAIGNIIAYYYLCIITNLIYI